MMMMVMMMITIRMMLGVVLKTQSGEPWLRALRLKSIRAVKRRINDIPKPYRNPASLDLVSLFYRLAVRRQERASGSATGHSPFFLTRVDDPTFDISIKGLGQIPIQTGQMGMKEAFIRDYEATRCSRGSVVFKNPIDLPDLPETRQMSLKLDLFVLPEVLTKTPVKCRA